MWPLQEIPTVKEQEHLEPRILEITGAVFPEGLYINWRGRQEDQASFKLKVGDGFLLLPKENELWLVELEWKLRSNYLDQVSTFAESRIVDTEKLQRVLIEELEGVCGDFGLHPAAVPDKVELIMLKHHVDGLLRPNMWVVLGHHGDDSDNLRKQYIKKTKQCFDKNVVTMVRLFTGDDREFLLLDNYWSDIGHTALLTSPHAYDKESMIPMPPKNGGTRLRQPAKRVHKAEEVWDYLHEKYPDLKQENLRLQIRPGFERFHNFRIAWKKDGNFLWVVLDNVAKKPTSAAKKVFPDLVDEIPASVAQHWGKYIDISEDPPKKLATYEDVNRLRREPKGEYDRENREPKPCSEFFEDQTKYDDPKYANILSNYRLWKALLEKPVLTTKEWIQLTGIEGRGRSASVDHKLTGHSVVAREGREFRLTDEARPYVERLLAESDIPRE